MRHRLAALTPDVGRETLTLYGGLFLVVLFGYSLWTHVLFTGLLGDGLSVDIGLWFVGGLTFGFVPAVLSMLFLKAHRYAYPPDA
ncbi:hypothetical protein HTZ84_22595 [Haloterrigena sp. SYSU A558-1]|uniref:DUF485 domain-containing protein n=1 Tax=Haloterrigena gelatinilytica TaxID=2741724 RepID=A0ABX2LI42_9EURY|nr:hypothetical protein [Haloterrigena gelatinilytica]NUC75058.1 hypothetical protein [Haloterrigena gelatinilytica]